jgi:hypothetical protein
MKEEQLPLLRESGESRVTVKSSQFSAEVTNQHAALRQSGFVGAADSKPGILAWRSPG